MAGHEQQFCPQLLEITASDQGFIMRDMRPLLAPGWAEPASVL